MGEYPRYFIYGPIVFMTASQELAAAIGRTGATISPLGARRLDPPAFPGEEIVVLGEVAHAQDVQGLHANALQRGDARQRHGGPQPRPPG